VIPFVGAVSAKLSWYTARSSGLIAWAVVTASILLGLALSTRLIRRKGVPAWSLDLHKFLGTLSVVLSRSTFSRSGPDNFVYFGPAGLFVPMGRGVATGPGCVGHCGDLSARCDPDHVWTMRRLPRPLVARRAPHELSDVRNGHRARLHHRC